METRKIIDALRHVAVVAEILADTEPGAAREVLVLGLRDLLRELARP